MSKYINSKSNGKIHLTRLNHIMVAMMHGQSELKNPLVGNSASVCALIPASRF